MTISALAVPMQRSIHRLTLIDNENVTRWERVRGCLTPRQKPFSVQHSLVDP